MGCGGGQVLHTNLAVIVKRVNGVAQKTFDTKKGSHAPPMR